MRFGRYPNEEKDNIKRYWGARAIFYSGSNYTIDIPYDRKTYEGDEENAQPFFDWINNNFMKWLEKEANANLFNDQRKVIKYESEDGKYQGEACCQGSYGYLYIGCWEK
jgi:hypothetical protein